MKTYYIYDEVEIPQEILKKLEESAIKAQEDFGSRAITLKEAGLYDWINKMSKDDGWELFYLVFPNVILRKQIIEKT